MIEHSAIIAVSICIIGLYENINTNNLEISPMAAIFGISDKYVPTLYVEPSYISIIQLLNGIHPSLKVSALIISIQEIINIMFIPDVDIASEIFEKLIFPVIPYKYEIPNNNIAEELAPVTKYFSAASFDL